MVFVDFPCCSSSLKRCFNASSRLKDKNSFFPINTIFFLLLEEELIPLTIMRQRQSRNGSLSIGDLNLASSLLRKY